jgi:hypothetical protein
MANKLAESKIKTKSIKGPGDGKPQISKSDTTKPKMMGGGSIRMISEKDAIKKFGQNKVDSLNKAYDEEIRKYCLEESNLILSLIKTIEENNINLKLDSLKL